MTDIKIDEHLEEHIRDIVSSEIAKAGWRVIGFLGIPIVGLIIAVAGSLAIMTKHISDGHPAVVHARVTENQQCLVEMQSELNVWRAAGLPLVMVELRSDMTHVKSTLTEVKGDLSELKKKWELSVDSP